jgi:hypothetical protein
MKNGLKGIVMLIGGIFVIGFGVYALTLPDFPKLFNYGLFLIGAGAISVGFSLIGCKGIAIPFAIAMMLGSVYLIYQLVKLLILW